MMSAYHIELYRQQRVCRNRNKDASEAPSHARILAEQIYRVALGLDEHNHQREQNQRFDQRQTQNHHGLNLCCCTRIASSAFASCRANARLTKRAANTAIAKPDSRRNCLESGAIVDR